MRAVPGLVPNVSGEYVPFDDTPPGSPERRDARRDAREVSDSLGRRAPSTSSGDSDEDEAFAPAGVEAVAALSESRSRAGAKRLWIGRAKELAEEMLRLRGDASAVTPRASSRPGAAGRSAVAALAALGPASDAFSSDDSNDPNANPNANEGFAPRPAIVFLGGSSGVAGDTLRYLRMFASRGHLVLCPDDFRGWPARLRHRPARSVRPDEEADYWSANLLYSEAPASGELVYESCAEQYTSSDRLAQVYDATLRVKHAALTKVLLDLPETMGKRGIYLAGNSEGAIVLGMMDDAVLDAGSETRRMSGTMRQPEASASARAAANERGGGGGGSAARESQTSHAKSLARDAAEKAAAKKSADASLGPAEPWEAKLLGRINIAYSLEPNYFTYRTLKRHEPPPPPPFSDSPPPSRSTSGLLRGGSEDGTEHGSDDGGSSGDLGTSPMAGSRSSGYSLASKPSWSSIESGLVAAAIRRAPRGLFGSRWRRDVPTLCVNGSMDQFFGRRNSVSETVVKRASDSMLAKGDRPHITGDAALRMAELGMTRALVAQMEGAKHAMCATHDFALRELLADFLNDPVACASIPERWEEDDRKERMMLWHSVVTPGKCSFASIASTERAAGFSSGPPRPPGADSPIREGDARRRGHARKISEVPPVRSFLDLTSAMAKLLVRGGSQASPSRNPSRDASARSLVASSVDGGSVRGGAAWSGEASTPPRADDREQPKGEARAFGGETTGEAPADQHQGSVSVCGGEEEPRRGHRADGEEEPRRRGPLAWLARRFRRGRR